MGFTDLSKFKPTWNSLSHYRVPEWFKDAKLGVFFHWGVYSVPAYLNEWYPRYIYAKKFMNAREPERAERCRDHHIRTWGYWQTDTSVNLKTWGYVENTPFKSADVVIHELIDIVSKNGNLLINFGPTCDDIRFTRKGEDVYAIILGIPNGPVKIRSLAKDSGYAAKKIARVSLLGSDEPVKWEVTPEALVAVLPATKPTSTACTLKVEF